MSTVGYDVSVFQSHTPTLDGRGFLFARATYATSPDAGYARHIANAKLRGLVTGAYHFGVNADPAAQARAFLAAAGKVDLYVLDLESDGNRPRMTDQQAGIFMAAVRAKGHKVGLYHSDSGFPSLGQDYNWVAKWGPNPPSRAWAFWQYRGSPLDLDAYNGTLAQLKAFVGRAPPPPQPTPATFWASDIPADVRALDPTGKSAVRAFKKLKRPYGFVINLIDLEMAFNDLGWNYKDPGHSTSGYVNATKQFIAWGATK